MMVLEIAHHIDDESRYDQVIELRKNKITDTNLKYIVSISKKENTKTFRSEKSA